MPVLSHLATFLKPIGMIGFLAFYYTLLFVSLFTNLFRKLLFIFGLRPKDNNILPINNCHPDVFVDTCKLSLQCILDELIKDPNFDFQIYEAKTEDDAYVTLWRLRMKNHPKTQYLRPVLIQHGLLDCAMSWFIHENKQLQFYWRNQSLPFKLAREGFDVWLGNNRGTKFSQKNENKPGYYDFNIDSFARYDQPALINKVLQETGKEKLIYIGHSQGSTQFLIAQGIRPELQDKILIFFGMGAVISLENLRYHKLLHILDKFYIAQILQTLGFKCIFHLPQWMHQRVGTLCYNFRPFRKLVFGFINFLCGKPKKTNISTSRLGVLVTHEPGGTSPAAIIQWIQGFRYGKLRRFDYGKKENILKYGSESPPQYSFNHMRTIPYKSHIYRGTKDVLISDSDFDYMLAHFKKDSLTVHYVEDYAHLDYAWSQMAHKDIYEEMVRTIKKEDEDLQILMHKQKDVSQMFESSNCSQNEDDVSEFGENILKFSGDSQTINQPKSSGYDSDPLPKLSSTSSFAKFKPEDSLNFELSI